MYVIDVEAGREVQVYDGHSRMIRDVTFSPDGARIVMQDSEGLQLVGPPVAELYDIFKNAAAFLREDEGDFTRLVSNLRPQETVISS